MACDEKSEYDPRLANIARQFDDYNWDITADEIDSLSLADFSTHADSALYILLYCRHQHNKGITLPFDTLIPFASDYYSTGKEPMKAMMAWYIRACTYFDNGYGTESTYYAMKMYDYAKQLDNDLYMARFHDIMGHALAYGSKESALNYTQALKHIHKAQPKFAYNIKYFYDHAYTGWAQADIADSALAVCKFMIPIIKEDTINYDIQKWSENYAVAYMQAHKTNLEDALKAYDELDSIGLKYDAQSPYHQAIKMVVEGITTNNHELLKKATQFIKEHGFSDAFQSQPYMRREHLNVLSEQTKYYNERIDTLKSDNHSLHSKLLIGCAITIILIIAIIMAYHSAIRRKERRLREKIEQLNELKFDMEMRIEDKSEVTNKLRTLTDQLYADRLKQLNNLCDTFFNHRESGEKAKAIFYHEFEQQISDLGSQKSIDSIEHLVNECKDNLIVKLRDQLPQLKKADVNLLIYIYAGFAARAICLFTGISKDTYYMRRRRIKARIEKSTAPDREMFIEQMN